MKIIDGKKIASGIKAELKKKIAKLPDKPGLAIILIGDDLGSHVYVGLKEKAAEEAGIYFEKYQFSESAAEEEVMSLIKKLNVNDSIHGIVVQFPLPANFSKENILTVMTPKKDVDGFHPENITRLLNGRPRLVPGLAAGVLRLIKSTGEQLAGKQAVVVTNSKVFSEPLGYLLKQEGVDTSACNSETSDCKHLTRQSDILAVAIGRPRFIRGEMIKQGAIIIDIGYNQVNGKAVGDVDFESVKEKAGWLTPVPGGVGPMTVAMLLNNVLNAYEIQKSG